MNKLFSVGVLFLFFQNAFSQTIITPTSLNAKSRTEIVTTVSELLKANYVFPDVAVKMSSLINDKLKKGKYNNITDPVQLGDILTTDALSINQDGHLRVEYNPAFFAQRHDTTGEDQRELQQQKRNLSRNYGFKKAEILNGNIGYLELSGFYSPSKKANEAALTILKFLSHCNSLIIDLRDNGGGSPEMIRYLLNYFFDTKTHINDFYMRSTNTISEIWTNPDTSQINLTKMPLYILVGGNTASASEEFCYDLQNLHRATVVGTKTGGAAHPTMELDASNGFVLYNPYARAINPVTKTNWEGVGIIPEIICPKEIALETAHLKILEDLSTTIKDPFELFDLNWYLDIVKCSYHPVIVDTLTLKKYAGIFGERTITFENGKLFYQRVNKPKFEMEFITKNLMKAKNNTYFKIELIEDEKGNVNDLKAYYQDKRIETAKRNN
ncbi:MAG: S41 family peptidase [Bacteroidia bacterium]